MRRLVVLAVLGCGSREAAPPAPAPATTTTSPRPPPTPKPPTSPSTPLPTGVASQPAPAPAASTPTFTPTAFTVEVAGSGRPVILIPGLGCPGSVWNDTVAHLQKAGRFETHVLHAAGFAGHAPISQPVVPAIPEQLAAYIRDRKLDHPIVVGHSMGGFEAIWLAETDPDLLGGIVVVDAGPTLGGGDPDLEPFARTQRERYRTMPAADFIATLRERFSAMFRDPKLAPNEAIIAAVTRSDQQAFTQAYWDLNSIDLRPKVNKITVPTLLVVVDQPPARFYKEPLSPLKQLRVVTIADSRHFVMQDAPDAFYQALDPFLADPARKP